MTSKSAGVGQHLIADIWGAKAGKYKIRSALASGALAAGATILKNESRRFEGGGWTGYILLAESHISVHTWPEKDYIALDIFMCGDCDPRVAYEYIIEKIKPEKAVMAVMQRGVET